jgi:TolB protein
MKKLLLVLGIATFCIIGFIARAETKSNIKELVLQLCSNDSEVCNKAQKQLIELGENLIKEYRKAKFKGKAREKDLINIKGELELLSNEFNRARKDENKNINKRIDQICQRLYFSALTKIAFVERPDDKECVTERDIYITETTKGNSMRLTRNRNNNSFPVWNPDGTKIAYSASSGIYIMDADGKNKEQLVKNDASTSYIFPAWSPEGTKIVFIKNLLGNDNEGALYIMDTDGKNQKELAKIASSGGHPDWSPDGTKIVFNFGLDIFVMDADGKNPRRMQRGFNLLCGLYPEWNPKGTKVAFSAEKDKNWPIFVMDANGENIKQITKTKMNHFSPTWNPEGTKIAFVVEGSDNVAISNIYIMDADGQNKSQLTNNGRSNTFPDWCPLSIEEIAGLFETEIAEHEQITEETRELRSYWPSGNTIKILKKDLYFDDGTKLLDQQLPQKQVQEYMENNLKFKFESTSSGTIKGTTIVADHYAKGSLLKSKGVFTFRFIDCYYCENKLMGIRIDLDPEMKCDALKIMEESSLAPEGSFSSDDPTYVSTDYIVGSYALSSGQIIRISLTENKNKDNTDNIYTIYYQLIWDK